MAGYNYEQSTYESLAVTRNGLIFADATNINLALGQSITPAGELGKMGYSRWILKIELFL